LWLFTMGDWTARQAMFLHRRFIIRQLTRSPKQALVFVLCVVLAIVTLIGLNGFSHSVHTSLMKEARQLHAADIILHSHYPFSAGLTQSVSRLEKQGKMAGTRIYEFYSVVRTDDGRVSLLAHIKVVGKGYPFYGRVELSSKRDFSKVLRPGEIIVERTLLERLGLQLGARVHVGKATLTIADIVESEPDRPVDFFSLGPRVFVSLKDLESLDLVRTGSRVNYTILLKVYDSGNLQRIFKQLQTAAVSGQEQVDTFRSARSRLKRFLDNFLFFLSLIGIFTLLLAGIGIQSSLMALLKEKEQSIAVMKTVGATNRFITLHFLVIIGVLGVLGTGLGLGLGFLLQYALPLLLSGFLPEGVQFSVSWIAVLEGSLLGILVVALFAYLPLHRLRGLKPTLIFRKEEIPLHWNLPYYVVALAILLFFTAMVFWQLRDVKTGLSFVGGSVLLILLSGAAAEAVLCLLRRSRLKSLALRQAAKGLFRPRNSTALIIITLTTSLSVLFAIYLVEQNLNASFVTSYPADVPNLFFIDIQPSQVEQFSKVLGRPAIYYPVVRARIESINGKPVNREEERQRRGDNLAREFNLTYRDSLLADETMLEGKTLFRKNYQGNQVSILDTVTKIGDIRMGDRVTFNIQGVPLTALVTSIRSRTRETIQPFFYFVFPPEVLRGAPQTIFTALRVGKEHIAELENRIVARFPNVSFIDVSATISTFARVLDRLSSIVQFFALFSLVAGMLIIISSLLATRFARIQEAVYFKILGARQSFVLKVFTLENLLLGLVSGLLALLFAQVSSWVISSVLLDILYRPFPGPSLLLLAGAALLSAAAGLLSSRAILSKKPVVFLREQADE
jgi:putative ABC transport system permease protein